MDDNKMSEVQSLYINYAPEKKEEETFESKMDFLFNQLDEQFKKVKQYANFDIPLDQVELNQYKFKSPKNISTKNKLNKLPLSPLILNILNDKEFHKRKEPLSSRINKDKIEQNNYIKIIKRKNNDNLKIATTINKNKKVFDFKNIKSLDYLDVNESKKKQNHSCNKEILSYNNKKNINKIKKSLELYIMKEKARQRNKKINDKEKNKVKEEAFDSLIKIIKSNDKGDKFKRAHSRTHSYMNKINNFAQTSSKSIKRSAFNLTGKNKYLSYQILKQGEKFLNSDVKTSEKKPINLFQEKSKLALLKQISAKIIKEKIDNKVDLMNKLNKRCLSNYNIRNTKNMKQNLKLEESKNFFDSNIQKKFINKTASVKFYEMSKKRFNFSDILIVENKKYPNSRSKQKKLERKIPLNYITSMKRPLSSLERYYIKYGAIP